MFLEELERARNPNLPPEIIRELFREEAFPPPEGWPVR
jgi:hypothetical protein